MEEDGDYWDTHWKLKSENLEQNCKEKEILEREFKQVCTQIYEA